MIVIIPTLSGFCPGVKIAERKVFETKRLIPDEPLYVNGFLINNKRYIEYLEKNGIHTIDSVETIREHATVFIRTHGVDRMEETVLRAKYDVVDLTCSKVKNVQHEISRNAALGCCTVIVGAKNHPETKGLISYTENRFFIIENTDDLHALTDNAIAAGFGAPNRNIFLCSQTTGSRELFEEVRQRFSAVLGEDTPTRLRVLDSICPVTESKEKESLKLQQEAEISFVIGDKLSSNAKKLFRVLCAAKKNVFFIEDLRELQSLEIPLADYHKALVVSSASTPDFIEREIVAYLSAV